MPTVPMDWVVRMAARRRRRKPGSPLGGGGTALQDDAMAKAIEPLNGPGVAA